MDAAELCSIYVCVDINLEKIEDGFGNITWYEAHTQLWEPCWALDLCTLVHFLCNHCLMSHLRQLGLYEGLYLIMAENIVF